MFETISIHRNRLTHDADPIDLGFLAETMLFYQQVRVIADYRVLDQLLRDIGPELLIEFIELGYLEVIFLENNLGIMTRNQGTSSESHEPAIYSIDQMTLQEAAPKLFIEHVKREGRGRRLARRFMSLTKLHMYDQLVVDGAKLDFSDTSFVTGSIAHLLKTYIPDYSQSNPLVFNLLFDKETFRVETNINFELANEFYHNRFPNSRPHSVLTPAYLLSDILNAQGDLNLSSVYSSELAVNSAASGILKNKIEALLDVRVNNEKQISLFQDMILDNSIAIRESINSGQLNFPDFLDVLKKSNKFKLWLKNQDKDHQLIKEYIRELRAISWLDKLPGKYARWLIFTGAGLSVDALGGKGLGTAMSIGVSALDSLLLDKLIKGWKPNHFVDNFLSQLADLNKKSDL